MEYYMFQKENYQILSERPFYKTGRHFPLGKINLEGFTSFVVERFKNSGKNISKDLAKKLLR